jgi:hypothetical protein
MSKKKSDGKLTERKGGKMGSEGTGPMIVKKAKLEDSGR